MAKKNGRIYWRNGRAYADFRDYSDVGGGRERLAVEGEAFATKDPDVAAKLVSDRITQLEEVRRNKALLGVERQTTLATFASHHLVEKKKAGRVTDRWLQTAQMHLEHAVGFFGAGRDPASITVRDVNRFADHLRKKPGRGGNKTISDSTVRQYLNSLSNLFRRAEGEGYLRPGQNPVAAMLEKPVARTGEAEWLEVSDAALLLEAARLHRPSKEAGAIPYIYPLIATFLLTGGRKSGVLGLEKRDILFDRGLVRFRPNKWRRLKTRGSNRPVPLSSQLRSILGAYLEGPQRPKGKLLFPAVRVEKEQPLTDIRKSLDAVAEAAGWEAGDIRTKMFRHTYCAARLQTLDRGHPVSPYTVGKELGHGGNALVERVYGHLGEVRHRSEEVEFLVEQHTGVLGERLTTLQNGTD